MSDSTNLCSQEMSLLSWEGRIALNGGIEISSADMFDESGSLNLCRGNIWQLDPVFQQVVIDPVYEFVDSFTSLFDFP